MRGTCPSHAECRWDTFKVETSVSVCLCFMSVFVGCVGCVCVCVYVYEREGEKQRQRQRETDGERERKCARKCRAKNVWNQSPTTALGRWKVVFFCAETPENACFLR